MRTNPDSIPVAESTAAVWAGRIGGLVLLVAIGHVLLASVRLMRYSGPVADEMLLAGNVRTQGFWPYLAEEYLHWTGRWSGVGTFLVLGRWFDFRISYGWLLAAIQLTLPLAVYSLLSAIFRDRLARFSRAVLSLALVALHWAGDPSMRDSYNWLTGAIENHLSLSLGLVLLAGLIRIYDQSPRPWVIASLAMLAVVATGMHHLYGAYFCGAVLFGTGVCYRFGAPGRRTWAVASAAAVMGLAVTMLAPGNHYRFAAERPIHEIWWLRILVRWWGALVVGHWVCDLRLWLATLALVCHPRAAVVAPAWLCQRRRWWAAGAATATVGIITVAIFANWWTFRTPLPGRTQSAIYFLFLLGWFATAYAIAAGPATQTPRTVRAGLAGCFGLALLTGGNYSVARYALDNGRAAAFHWAVDQRDREIRSAVAAGNCDPCVTPITPLPSCYVFAEVVDESIRGPCWYNDAYCKYYGLNSIRPAIPPATVAAPTVGRETIAK